METLEVQRTADCPRTRVLVLAPYPDDTAPSQRYRFEQYISYLAEQRIDMEVSSFLPPAGTRLLYARGKWTAKLTLILRGTLRRLWDVARCGRYDLVFIHREAFPVGPAWVERTLALRRIPYLYDFDDAVYLPNVSRANQAIACLKWPGKIRAIVRGAQLVVAGNEHLAEWARQTNSRVRVVPTTIDTDAYRTRQRTPPSARPVIGWTGSGTTIQHLEPLGPILRDLHTEHGVEIRVISDVEFHIEGAQVDSRRWASATEVEDLDGIDIGIMPLPDDEWTRGKCGAKALQFMAMGIPTVMSPVGANIGIAHKDAALLASSPEEWRSALIRLIEDPDLRRRTGEAGRRRVLSVYSVSANAAAWVDAIMVAIGRREFDDLEVCRVCE